MEQAKTFNADAYKKQAWQQLKDRWGVPIAMTLVSFSACVGVFVIAFFYSIFNSLFAKVFLFLGVWLVQIILRIPKSCIYVGMVRRSDKQHISFFGKKIKDTWSLGIKSNVIRYLLLFFWMLLLIFPLFIKYYAYSQMTYILAEHSKISITKAIKLSAIITKGHKKDLFLMQVSFLGWFLLTVIFTGGIGFLWLSSYVNLSFANAYAAMKYEALVMEKIPEQLRAEIV